jgi:hypothetical protein
MGAPPYELRHAIQPSLTAALDESLYRSVIGSLHLVREKAGGKFLHSPVILDALTADALAAARLVGAVAST